MDSATALRGSPVRGSYSTSPVNSASTTPPPKTSVVLPGTSGFSGSPEATLMVVSPAAPPPGSGPPPPPHAVVSSATDTGTASQVDADRRMNPPELRQAAERPSLASRVAD